MPQSRVAKVDYRVLDGLRPVESADSLDGSVDVASPSFSPHVGRSPERVAAPDDIGTPPRVWSRNAQPVDYGDNASIEMFEFTSDEISPSPQPKIRQRKKSTNMAANGKIHSNYSCYATLCFPLL